MQAEVSKLNGPLLGCLLALLAPAPAHAKTATDDWRWTATVYLWLPSIGGETAFPPDGGGPDIDVAADGVLDSLQSVFMGALEVHRGRWSVGTDLIYLDLEESKHGTRQFGLGAVEIPSSVNADLSFGITGTLWTLDARYDVVQRDHLSTSVLAGARMLDLEERLQYTFNGDISSLPLVERSGGSRTQETQVDVVAGVKGRVSFGADKQWYLPYHFDVGTGESDFTWQAMAGLGYSFGPVDILAVWRVLDYDLGDNTPVQSIDFNGGAVGVAFRF